MQRAFPLWGKVAERSKAGCGAALPLPPLTGLPPEGRPSSVRFADSFSHGRSLF